MADSIPVIAGRLLAAYRAEYADLIAQLRRESDELRREELMEAKAAFELVIQEFGRIRDVVTADHASQMLGASLQGPQPAAKFLVIDSARSAIADDILGPVHVVVPRETARGSAAVFLRREIQPATRAAILADIEREGLKNWSARFHMPFGMGVRNRLREAGYTEAALGVGTLDDIWSELMYEAVRD